MIAGMEQTVLDPGSHHIGDKETTGVVAKDPHLTSSQDPGDKRLSKYGEENRLGLVQMA